MTVLLLILTILFFLGVDALRHRLAGKQIFGTIPEDAYRHVMDGNIVYTMADGGEKIKVCPHCGQEVK